MNPIIKLSVLLLLTGTLYSCASRREIAKEEKLPRVKDEVLMTILDSLYRQHFTHFYTKVSTNYKDSSQNVSFKTSIRMVEDSAVNTLITYASLPIFNAVVTKDSLRMTNKRDKCYVLESLQYIRENFNVNFSYRNIEELILGLPLGYDTTQKYFDVNDPFSYTICSHKKHQIKKNERKDIGEVVIYYTLSNELNQLTHTRIESPEDSSIVLLSYKTRELVDGFNVPQLVEVSILTPRKSIKIDMDYKKTRIGIREDIYFVIPEEYEMCK